VSLIRSLRRWWNNRNAGWTLAEEQVAGLENGRRKAPMRPAAFPPRSSAGVAATITTGQVKVATYFGSHVQTSLPWYQSEHPP
jgi:hypothetical protein